MMMFDYSKYPNQSNVDGVRRYLEHGIPGGHFLTAVIENNLKEACQRADDHNRRILFEITRWFYNEAPAQSWGSPEEMQDWIKHSGMEGLGQ